MCTDLERKELELIVHKPEKKYEDNTILAVLKYVYKFFDNTSSKWWRLILFPLSVGWIYWLVSKEYTVEVMLYNFLD